MKRTRRADFPVTVGQRAVAGAEWRQLTGALCEADQM